MAQSNSAKRRSSAKFSTGREPTRTIDPRVMAGNMLGNLDSIHGGPQTITIWAACLERVSSTWPQDSDGVQPGRWTGPCMQPRSSDCPYGPRLAEVERPGCA